MIKLNSAIPLYQQVAEDLKNRIEQGEFCLGQSIPSEAKICKAFECCQTRGNFRCTHKHALTLIFH